MNKIVFENCKLKNLKLEKITFGIFSIIIICIFCYALSPISLQNDTFYTIKIGELISQNGIDMKDHFSWHENMPYTYPHWAYDCIIYCIFNLFGFTGIYISTIIFACVLGIILYITNYKISKNKVISLIISLIVMYLLRDYIAARAQLVTFILFTTTILFIEQFIETNKKRYLLFLLIIPIFIANLHVAVWPFYFILFIPYIAEAIIYYIYGLNILNNVKKIYYKYLLKHLRKKVEKIKNEGHISKINTKIAKIEKQINNLQRKSEESKIKILDKRKNPYKIINKSSKYIIWISLVCVLTIFTGLCTPLKTVPYTYLLRTMQGNTTQNINEHLPLTLINNKEILVVFAIILAILILTKVKIKLRDFFMLSGLLLLAFISRRQISMFVLIASPIVSKMIVNLIEVYKPKVYSVLEKIIKLNTGKIAGLLLIIICSILVMKPKLNEKYIDESIYPIYASNFIIESLDVNNIKLYNDYNYGSYLIYRDIPVFIDSRADLYAPEFNGTKNEKGKYEGRDIFSDYLNISGIATFYENRFKHYGITHVLTGSKSKLNMLLERDANYELIYKDNNFVIFKRNVAV